MTYVVWIELTVSGQTVQESLNVRSKDVVKSGIIDFIQMFSKTVPEVERNLHDLVQNKDQNYNVLFLCCGCVGYVGAVCVVVILLLLVLYLFWYLILRVSCTDQQQLECPQVSHTLPWTPDCCL